MVPKLAPTERFAIRSRAPVPVTLLTVGQVHDRGPVSPNTAPGLAMPVASRKLIEVRRQRTPLTVGRAGWPVYYGSVSEPGFAIRAEDQPTWAEVVRRAERGESVAVIAHGDHVADVVPSGELDRLRETIEVLSDTELVRDLQEGLADARAGRVFSAGQVAADLAARRVAGE